MVKTMPISAFTLLLLRVASVHAFYRHGKGSADGAQPTNLQVSPRCDVSLGDAHDCGEEVCITDFLGQGDAAGARKATQVFDVFPDDSDSYAGYALVNESAKNKLFFWYVPALNHDPAAPLLIWLQGGPGSSSLFGMFAENGPFSVESDHSTLSSRPSTWNKNQGMIFIDNPVGAGFSYTETEDGYCTNTKVEVSSQLYELMQQFYQVFPEQLENDLFITGESYAGHYVPGLAFKIHEENRLLAAANASPASGLAARVHIPLAGLAIGDGWIDPISQLSAYPDMLFDIGVADASEKLVFSDYVARSMGAIGRGDMYGAFTVWDEMINGDIYPYPNYYHNVTGSNDYDNFLNTDPPPSLGYYFPFVTTPSTRRGIHAGARTFGGDSATCEMNLIEDFMASFKGELEVLMDNYPVLIYSGQLDVIIGAALTEKMLPNLNWKDREAFTRAKKSIWRVSPSDADVAGYVKQAGFLTHAIVRGAGHLVPFDQPARALDLLEKWIQGEAFENVVNPV
jgi:vitellogenic carboxypeptidase-like protein